MTAKISKTNDDLEFLNSRIDEVNMSVHERLKAKAHLARAEAVAETLSWMAKGIARFFKGLTSSAPARPNRPAAPSAG